MLAIRRLIALCFCVGLFLAAFLQPIGAQRAAPQAVPIESLPPGVVIETVVPIAHQVVAMDFTPDGRLLYTERVSNIENGTYVGYVRVVQHGQLLSTPVFAFPVLQAGEQGLLGLDLTGLQIVPCDPPPEHPLPPEDPDPLRRAMRLLEARRRERIRLGLEKE